MAYADSLAATAATAAAEGQWSWRHARAGLGGSVATFEGDGWAAQGSASASQVLAARRDGGLFAHTHVTGYGFQGGDWAAVATAGIAGAAAIGPARATLSVAGGGVRRVYRTDDLLGQATARLRHERGAWAADLWASATRAGNVDYADVAAGIQAAGSRLSLDVAGGARLGDLGDVGWGQMRVALRVAGPGWVEAAVGRYPPDITGFTQGTFVQAGIRISLGRPPDGDGPGVAPSMVIERAHDGAVVITLRITDRIPAAIAGDWNAWSAEPLQRLDARHWRVRLALPAGIHRFTLLDADGNAFVPPGVPAEPDEFGTMTGLLVIPHR